MGIATSWEAGEVSFSEISVQTAVRMGLLTYHPSVVVNPQSRYHDSIVARLSALYEDAFFPLDMATLARNCVNFVSRVQRCNRTAIPVANFLSAHPSIAEVWYPSMVSTTPIYERYRRATGGYGSLMSIIFRNPRSAMRFFDVLDVCKGASFGTNFTMAIPYIQQAHFDDQDRVESYGIPKHLVRLTVGLEDEGQILKTLTRALAEVEKLEEDSRNGE